MRLRNIEAKGGITYFPPVGMSKRARKYRRRIAKEDPKKEKKPKKPKKLKKPKETNVSSGKEISTPSLCVAVS